MRWGKAAGASNPEDRHDQKEENDETFDMRPPDGAGPPDHGRGRTDAGARGHPVLPYTAHHRSLAGIINGFEDQRGKSSGCIAIVIDLQVERCQLLQVTRSSVSGVSDGIDIGQPCAHMIKIEEENFLCTRHRC